MPEQMQQSLLRIRDAGLRMGELIDDLLDFSRLSRQPLDRAPVDMTALARQAVTPQCDSLDTAETKLTPWFERAYAAQALYHWIGFDGAKG
jgi:signal transduction histidine kinase